jgi:hypothetical protein
MCYHIVLHPFTAQDPAKSIFSDFVGRCVRFQSWRIPQRFVVDPCRSLTQYVSMGPFGFGDHSSDALFWMSEVSSDMMLSQRFGSSVLLV